MAITDNQGAGKLAENPVHHSRSKHIDVKHHFIRQVLKEHPVDLTYLPTEKMVADVLTKCLPGPKHMECISGMDVRIYGRSTKSQLRRGGQTN